MSYLMLKINSLILRLKFIAQSKECLFIYFFALMPCKMCNQFFTIFLKTQMANRSQTSTGLSVYVYGGLHKEPKLPATVLLAQPFL